MSIRGLIDKIIGIPLIKIHLFQSDTFVKLYLRCIWNKKVKIENEGIIIFDDGSVINKTSFIDKCEMEKKDWLKELEKKYKEAGLT